MIRILVTLVAVVATVGLSTTAAPAQQNSDVAFMLVVNPSAKAIAAEIPHAQAVVHAVSAAPSVWILGIYEQRTSADRPPFNAPFLRTQTPRGTVRPPYAVREKCSETSGTDFVKQTCKDRHAETKAKNDAIDRAWNHTNRRTIFGWQTTMDAGLAKLGDSTEEVANNAWDLRGTLARIGNDLQYAPAGPRCVAFLGGLFVKQPPAAVDLSNFSGTTLIVAGWRSTNTVKRQWASLMRAAGARIEFLSVDVTDLALVDRVSICAGLPR